MPPEPKSQSEILADGESHGYGIMQNVEASEDGETRVTNASACGVRSRGANARVRDVLTYPSEPMEVELQIHTPLSTRGDRYFVTLSRSQLTFGRGDKIATCVGQTGDDPEWEDDERPKSILKRDAICPPAGFAKLLLRVWYAWLEGDLDEEGVAAELQALTNWLNASTRAMPRTEFWRRNI